MKQSRRGSTVICLCYMSILLFRVKENSGPDLVLVGENLNLATQLSDYKVVIGK